MKWKEIPEGARRYMLYHVLASPLLIVWYMLPFYMLITGYSVLEVGALFTLVSLISLPLSYLVGKIFSKVDLRKGLAIIDLMGGISSILYSFSVGKYSSEIIGAGMLIDELSGSFYPLYQAAERKLYPKDRLKEIFSWHLRVAEASQILGFLALGAIFTWVLGTPKGFREGFLVLGFCFIALSFYNLFALPRLEIYRVKREIKFKVDKEFRKILLFEAFLFLGWSLAPEMILINYVLKALCGNFFQVILISVGASFSSILATYLSERLKKELGGKWLALGYSLSAIQYGIMSLSPPFILTLLSYFIGRFGESLAFPFHRSWIFRKVPEEKSSEIFSALYSYRRAIGIVSPFFAGVLATIYPSLPYFASLLAVLAASTVGFLCFRPS